MSVNSFLLLKVAKTTTFHGDSASLPYRNQALSIIYINLSISLLVLVLRLLPSIPIAETLMNTMVFICMGSLFMGYHLLKKRKIEHAAASTLIFIHLLISFMSYFCLLPMPALSAQLILPTFAFLITSSSLIRWLNMITSLAQFTLHINLTQKIFVDVLTEEYLFQIKAFYIETVILFILVCAIFLIYKTLEEDQWNRTLADMQKLNKLTNEVVQTVEAKNAFISSLSHELRNPLNAIMGSIDYLQGNLKDALQTKFLSHAKISAEVLLNLVNNCLDAAKLRADKMDVIMGETKIEDIINKAININTHSMTLKRIKGKFLIDENLPKFLHIDGSRVLQILLNLISNAIKFTPNNGQITVALNWCPSSSSFDELLAKNDRLSDQKDQAKVHSLSFIDPISNISSEITRCNTEVSLLEYHNGESKARLDTIESYNQYEFKTMDRMMHHQSTSSAEKSPENSPWEVAKTNWPIDTDRANRFAKTEYNKEGFLKIQVSDTGCGVAENDIPKLFQMFAQVASYVRMANSGTGLGLWICKQLCQKMGGDISMYSKVNQGTTLVLYIPVSIHDLSRLRIEKKFKGTDGMKVLVANSLKIDRNLYKILLESRGIIPIFAESGKEALEIYKEKGSKYFDFILMDTDMTDIDGFSTTAMIRDWEKKTQIKITDIYLISNSHFTKYEMLELFKLKGYNNFPMQVSCLKKPLDNEMLEDVIKEVTAQC